MLSKAACVIVDALAGAVMPPVSLAFDRRHAVKDCAHTLAAPPRWCCF
jgi:hypothetical protein